MVNVIKICIVLLSIFLFSLGCKSKHKKLQRKYPIALWPTAVTFAAAAVPPQTDGSIGQRRAGGAPLRRKQKAAYRITPTSVATQTISAVGKSRTSEQITSRQ